MWTVFNQYDFRCFPLMIKNPSHCMSWRDPAMLQLQYQYSSVPGGGALDFHVDGGGGAAGGRKPDPVAMRSVHKKYTLSQYTLLKKNHMHTLSQYCTVAQWARNEQKCAKIGVGHRNNFFFHVLSKDYNLSNISEQYFFLKLILRG